MNYSCIDYAQNLQSKMLWLKPSRQVKSESHNDYCDTPGCLPNFGDSVCVENLSGRFINKGFWLQLIIFLFYISTFSLQQVLQSIDLSNHGEYQ